MAHSPTGDAAEGAGPRAAPGKAPGSGQLLVGLFFLGLGCFTALWVGRDTYEGWVSRRWPQTEGVVLRSWLEESSSRAGPQWTVRVRYRYTVDGTAYESDRGSYPEKTLGAREEAEREVSRYPAGSVCTVHYDPADPARACLEPGVNAFFACFFPPFALFFWFVGTGFVYQFYKSRTQAHTGGGIPGPPPPGDAAGR